jgi:SAM-dependent methyltransferase
MIAHVLLGLAVLALVSCYLSALWGAPWAPTPLSTVDRMLALGGVGPGKTVVDLGAGDGRIVIRAARRFGACAIGVEIDPLRCALANAAIWVRGLRSRARVIYGNIFYQDLSQADVITLYLLQATNQQLKPHLESKLRPGTRVVSHCFSFEGWTPIAIDEGRQLFVYEIGRVGPEVQTESV